MLPWEISGYSPALSPGLAAGLQLLTIRDLMLLPGWSVLGREDTVGKEQLLRHLHSCIQGTANFQGSQVSLEARFLGQPPPAQSGGFLSRLFKGSQLQVAKAQGPADRFLEVYAKLREQLVTQVAGLAVPSGVRQGWSQGRPANLNSLGALGRMLVEPNDNGGLVRRCQQEPGCGLYAVAWSGADPQGIEKDLLRKAARQDPYCAPVLFNLFIVCWEGGREKDQEAAQAGHALLRIAPGHGKGHMVFAHVIPGQHRQSIVRHSRLGYALLPGNHYALRNLANYLTDYEPGSPQRLELWQESARLAPHDAEVWAALALCQAQQGNRQGAQEALARIPALTGPPCRPQTLSCFLQSPARKAGLANGTFKPHVWAWKVSAEVLGAAGLLEEARSFAEKAAADNPQDPWLKGMGDKLGGPINPREEAVRKNLQDLAARLKPWAERLDTGSPEEIEEAIDSDTCVVVDWRATPEEIVEDFNRFLFPGFVKVEESPEELGPIRVWTSNGQAVVTQEDPPVGLQLASAIARLLPPFQEAHLFACTLESDTHCYLVAPSVWWEGMRAERPDRFGEIFAGVPGALFARASPRPSAVDSLEIALPASPSGL